MKSSYRVLIILVVGALLIALALVVNHNRNERKIRTLGSGQAVVLAADANGAVTQTQDGTMRGFTRDGKQVWTSAPRFGKNPNGQRVQALRNAFCDGACPQAFSNNAAGKRNVILFHSGAGGGKTTAPGPPLSDPQALLRGALGDRGVVVRTPNGSRGQYAFLMPSPAGADAKPLSDAVQISRSQSFLPMASKNRERVAMLEVGAEDGVKSLTLRWFQFENGRWNQTGKPLTEQRAEACFAGDGERVATVGKKLKLFAFGGGDMLHETPLKGAKAFCSFSSDGVTVYTVAGGNSSDSTLSHYDDQGRQKWSRAFTNSGAFFSRSGTNDLIQVSDNSGTQWIAASTGKTVNVLKGQTSAFAPGYDVFVKTDSAGKPNWLH